MSSSKPRRNATRKKLEGRLVSAVLTGGKELSHVGHHIHEIPVSLRFARPEHGVRSAATHPAIWYSVKQSLMERELSRLALCDDLTRLYNRRGFFAAAAQQLKMARRHQKPALLLFCDVDGLKSINDTFGHREGDLALVRAATALETVFRDSDVLARIGGDEFVVLAMDLPPRHQQTILSRLQKALRKAAENEPHYELALSIGVAWFDPLHPISLGDLIEKADRAMYECKQGNRTVFPLRELTVIRKTRNQ